MITLLTKCDEVTFSKSRNSFYIQEALVADSKNSIVLMMTVTLPSTQLSRGHGYRISQTLEPLEITVAFFKQGNPK